MYVHGETTCGGGAHRWACSAAPCLEAARLDSSTTCFAFLTKEERPSMWHLLVVRDSRRVCGGRVLGHRVLRLFVSSPASAARVGRISVPERLLRVRSGSYLGEHVKRRTFGDYIYCRVCVCVRGGVWRVGAICTFVPSNLKQFSNWFLPSGSPDLWHYRKPYFLTIGDDNDYNGLRLRHRHVYVRIWPGR